MADLNYCDPEHCISRLHTLITAYMRKLHTKYELQNSLFTSNEEKEKNKIFKEITDFPLPILVARFHKYLETIHRQNIFAIKTMSYFKKICDHFNDVRNNNSESHPNNLLAPYQAQLMCSYIINTLTYLTHLETELDEKLAR